MAWSHKAKEIACLYAKLIKSKCPSLRYINIRTWAWEYTDLPGKSYLSDEDISQIAIRPLEHKEILAIELFAMPNFTNQAGLVGLARPSEHEMSAEEEETLEALTADIDRRFAENPYAFLGPASSDSDEFDY